MKLLYLNAYLNRFDFWTGERGRQFVAALVSAGAEVQTLPEIPSPAERSAAKPGGVAARFKRLVMTRLSAKRLMVLIEVYLVGRGIVRTLNSAWQAWRRRHDLRPDVVLARTFEYEWTPWLVAAILKRPLILEVHAPFYVERRFRGRGRSRFFRWYEGVLWRRAARIWVHTRALQQIVADNDVDPQRIRVIPFGLPSDHFAALEPRGAGAHVQVVFVGSFYSWHGVDQIVEAFAIAHEKIDGLRLCLIGEGVTRAANEQRVRALGLEHRVQFPGWLPQHEVLAHLQESDIGVAPYRKLDPFYFEPVKILDYMAAGLAIVASDQGQVNELVTHGESAILVPPDDVGALARALVDLAEDEPLRRRLGGVAHGRVPTLLQTAQNVLAVASETTAANGARGEAPGRANAARKAS